MVVQPLRRVAKNHATATFVAASPLVGWRCLPTPPLNLFPSLLARRGLRGGVQKSIIEKARQVLPPLQEVPDAILPV